MVHPVLTHCLGVRQLHERRGRRVSEVLLGEFHPEAVGDLGAVTQCAVAHADNVLTTVEEIGDEVIDTANTRLADALGVTHANGR